MSPDIEWHIGQDDEYETVVPIKARPTARWRRLLLALSIMLGAGLGVLYVSIPASLKPPQPTPEPTYPPLPPLEPVVAREARALADGDRADFLSLQDQIDGEWYRAQAASFKAWGNPSGEPLYTIISQTTYAVGRAWVEMAQWRNPEVYVRETRFYQLRGNEWKRVRPDPAFWSGKQGSGRSNHFDITYPAEDNRWAWPITLHFERVYDVLCRDLNCPSRTGDDFHAALSFQPNDRPYTIEQDHGLTVTLPSPRLSGLFEPYGAGQDLYTQIAYAVLLDPITHLASGDAARWQTDHGGELFLQGIIAWQQLRINAVQSTPPEKIAINAPGELFQQPSQGDPAETQQFYRNLLAKKKIRALKDLWFWPPAYTVSTDLADRTGGEVDAFIAYLEQRYGTTGVIKLLNALGPASSLQEAIQTALATKYDNVEQQWLAWIGK